MSSPALRQMVGAPPLSTPLSKGEPLLRWVWSIHWSWEAARASSVVRRPQRMPRASPLVRMKAAKSSVRGTFMGLMAVLTTEAPASTAAAAQAAAIFIPSHSSTPSSTPDSAGTFSRASLTNPAHSKAVIIPAESQRVTLPAPASTAAVRTS